MFEIKRIGTGDYYKIRVSRDDLHKFPYIKINAPEPIRIDPPDESKIGYVKVTQSPNIELEKAFDTELCSENNNYVTVNNINLWDKDFIIECEYKGPLPAIWGSKETGEVVL